MKTVKRRTYRRHGKTFVAFEIESVKPLRLCVNDFTSGRAILEKAQKWATENGGGRVE